MNKLASSAEKKTAYTTGTVLGAGVFFCIVAFQIWPDTLLLLGALCGALGLLVVLSASFIVGLRHWRVSFLPWMGPVVLSAGFILMIPLYQWIGRSIADFRMRAHINEYTAIVDQIRSGTLPAPRIWSKIEIKTLPSGVQSVQAVRNEDGSVIAVFVTGTGFPLHHVGYVFNGSGTNMDCATQFNSFCAKVALRKVVGEWYQFSN